MSPKAKARTNELTLKAKANEDLQDQPRTKTMDNIAGGIAAGQTESQVGL